MHNLIKMKHPRPDFRRDAWKDLNGIWRFSFDDFNEGVKLHLYECGDFIQEIKVPFVYQCAASTIGDTKYHPILWYAREFMLPNITKGKRVLLHFGAVDFETDVWVNGFRVGSHKGGYTPFDFDITNYISEKSNLLVVRVADLNDLSQPRGKQYWEQEGDRCWYTQSSGIWQSVWLEFLPNVYIRSLQLIPDIDFSRVDGQLFINMTPERPISCRLMIWWKSRKVREIEFDVPTKETSFSFTIVEPDSIDEIHYWSPDSPNLYRVDCCLIDNDSIDKVQTWFGMRKISIANGNVLLNNRPLYQRLVLVQGYWPESLLSPPSEEAFQLDLEMIKSMGFNGIRMHQKIEDPRFYHLADRIGLLVWAEMPSTYTFGAQSRHNFIREWQAFIERDINHPSIICWVPFNESWGVRNIAVNRKQQEFAVATYHLTKALDSSRLIDTNDGWEQVESDLCGVHDYSADARILSMHWSDLFRVLTGAAQTRLVYAQGFIYTGQPVLITEFGGVAFASAIKGKNWGYASGVEDEKSYVHRIESLVKIIIDLPNLQGYCYTQFTDVMQEVNGLTDINRNPKIPINTLREIFSCSPNGW